MLAGWPLLQVSVRWSGIALLILVKNIWLVTHNMPDMQQLPDVHCLAGFEKECQDFLQMIQEDGDSTMINFSTLNSFDSSDLSNSTHSSLLSSAELSAGPSPLGKHYCSCKLSRFKWQRLSWECQYAENRKVFTAQESCTRSNCNAVKLHGLLL